MGKFQEAMERHTRSEIELPKSPLHDNDYTQANADLPLFLDSMLYYLRIQADSFAGSVADRRKIHAASMLHHIQNGSVPKLAGTSN